MKIRVVELVQDVGGLWVQAACNSGSLWGLWQGEPPRVDHEYYVELEIAQTLRVGETITAVAHAAPQFQCVRRGECVRLIGQVAKVLPEEQMILLAIGDGTVEIKVDGKLDNKCWVECQAINVKIYDCNY